MCFRRHHGHATVNHLGEVEAERGHRIQYETPPGRAEAGSHALGSSPVTGKYIFIFRFVNPYNAKIFVYKQWRPTFFFLFEIIINMINDLVSTFRFICIPMLSAGYVSTMSMAIIVFSLPFNYY